MIFLQQFVFKKKVKRIKKAIRITEWLLYLKKIKIRI